MKRILPILLVILWSGCGDQQTVKTPDTPEISALRSVAEDRNLEWNIRRAAIWDGWTGLISCPNAKESLVYFPVSAQTPELVAERMREAIEHGKVDNFCREQEAEENLRKWESKQ